jgi:hypothetical protein
MKNADQLVTAELSCWCSHYSLFLEKFIAVGKMQYGNPCGSYHTS